jgi:cytochrome c
MRDFAMRGPAALALMLCASAVHADAEFAKQKNCLNCHQIDTKLIGPPYKQVAAKYRGDPDAENRLVKKVLEGSFGAWGQVPMPANPITEAQARILVKWVLSQ